MSKNTGLKEGGKNSFLIIALIMATMQLLSCSSSVYKYFYNSFDTFMVRSIDSYLDVNQKQLQFLEKRLKRFRQWHRKNELQDYIVLLKNFRQNVAAKVSRRDVEKFKKILTRKAEKYYLFLADDTVQFLSTVNDGQIRHLEKKLNENLAKMKKKSARTAKEKHEERTKSLLRGLESIYGDFSESQKRQVAVRSSRIRDILPLQIKQREKTGKKFIELLTGSRKDKNFKGKFKNWMAVNEKSKPLSYKRALKTNNTEYLNILLHIDNNLVTETQRNHALKKIDQLIKIISELRQPE